MARTRVLIADDEEVFREGLARLLKDQPHIEVISQCGSGKEAVEKSKETRPEVILMNSHTSDLGALETITRIKEHSPEIKIAILTRPGVGPDPLRALKAGARAYLAKTISVENLVKSIDLISSGRIIISPVFSEKFLAEIAAADNADSLKTDETKSGLSEREIEIATLISQGHTNKEIAQKLFIAENTAKVHVKNMLEKLELRNRQQLVAYVILQKWVTTDETVEEGRQNGSS